VHGRQWRGQRARVFLALAQPDALLGGEQCGRGDLLAQLQAAQRVAGGDGAHAHLVLIVAFGGAREDAGRHAVLQRFGGPGAGADLHRLEAVVDHRRGGRRAGGPCARACWRSATGASPTAACW